MNRLLAAILTVCAVAGVGARVPTRLERLVYIGTYTPDTNATSTSKGIYAFRFDDASGTLTPIGIAAETPSPSFLTASADGRFVFAVNELPMYQGAPSGAVSSFSVDRATGKLTLLSSQPSQGAGPCHLALDATGRYLAVANYNGGNFALFPVGTDGRIQPAVAVVAGEPTMGPDAAPLTGLGHMVAFDRTNRFLLASDKGLNKLLIFRFDAARGTLTPNTPPSAAIPQPRSGPRHFVFDPPQQFLFSIAEQAATITSFAWNATTGTLTPTGGVVPTRPAGVTSGSTAEIVMHPSGRFVYGSNRGHNSIAVFRVGANGALTLVEHELTRGTTPRNFNIDPTGKWIIAANQGTGNLGVFRVDQNTGALDPVGGMSDVSFAVDVLFLP